MVKPEPFRHSQLAFPISVKRFPLKEEKNMRSRWTPVAYVCSAILFVLIVLSPTSLRAQEARGTFSGTVMDSNKAVVPGATITITNVAMGTNHTVTTNESVYTRCRTLYPERIESSSKDPGSKNTSEKVSPSR